MLSTDTKREWYETEDGRLAIDVWSDIMCPFCYIGDTTLQKALDQFEHADQIQVRHRSFELRPELPVGVTYDLYEHLAKSYNMSVAQAREMNANVARQGAELGLQYDFDSVKMTNTRSAHRLTHHAAAEGRGQDMVTRLYRAYFREGEHVGQPQVLADLAADIGLDREAALAVVESDTYDDTVQADEDLARQLGVRGVPFFVFDGKYAISGARPIEAFTEALQKTWNEHASGATADS